eukprot:CAMPEP_0114329106 /NCGR_PEP_ID=MMETSP0101-20121206/855_1 /TAXON_ID=38822 ORGANISM="Pteridomonas danica, Strain PT" /NCGR_SAMPLE_ID=MMETSP0101 /ASSEMBLY_ACC=CAM_ASM_000211 /LENGTH=382 /DNA_ID=CAMNT_0001458657 /DNA_START=72 /DNA_END=1221 /DNA_ORIENTATION=-
MPAVPLQEAAAGQSSNLDKTRVKSTIPKGGTETTWEYPSPQMFWNAMVRKNKADGASEEDMDMVVAIHNNMNESTWQAVMEWEKLHEPPADVDPKDAQPTLLRFTGRPDENSPKAMLKSIVFGCPEPFDRHDWIVDRGGKEVRYIIDYFHDHDGVDRDAKPGLHDQETIQSRRIDVRPALDSFESVIDRVFRMPFSTFLCLTPTSNFKYLPLFRPKDNTQAQRYGNAMGKKSFMEQTFGDQVAWLKTVSNKWKGIDDVAPSSGTNSSAGPKLDQHLTLQQNQAPLPPHLAQIMEKLDVACNGCRARVAECNGEDECRNASIALTYCMANIICNQQARKFEAALQNDADETAMEGAYEAMASCIDVFQVDAQKQISEAKSLTK